MGSVADYYPPAIAWTSSSAVLVGVSENGSLNFWWQAAGPDLGTRSTSPPLAPAGITSIRRWPQRAARSSSDSDGSDFPGGNLDYWWQQDGTRGWNQQQVAPGNQQPQPAAAGGLAHNRSGASRHNSSALPRLGLASGGGWQPAGKARTPMVRVASPGGSSPVVPVQYRYSHVAARRSASSRSPGRPDRRASGAGPYPALRRACPRSGHDRARRNAPDGLICFPVR